jgi:hypothetical protein
VGGEPFSVSWTVQNIGDGAANGGWFDHLYLSDQPTRIGAGVHVWDLGAFVRPQTLASGESYTNTQTLLLNPAAKGQYIIVESSLFDLDRDNNVGVGTTAIVDRVPDLKVVSIVPQAQVFSGEKTTITYTVVNDSDVPVWFGTDYWSDQIWFSKDPSFIRSRATQLATVQVPNSGPLAAHASYTRPVEVTLPPGIGGQYYVYVFANSSAPDLAQPWSRRERDQRHCARSLSARSVRVSEQQRRRGAVRDHLSRARPEGH